MNTNGTAHNPVRTMGLMCRSWPLGMSPSVRGGDDTGVPSVLTTAGDGGIRRGLRASDPWTEPAYVE